jgi:glutaredoxin 3
MAQALGELGEIALEVGEFEHLAEGESVRRPYQPVPGERGPGAAGTPRIFPAPTLLPRSMAMDSTPAGEAASPAGTPKVEIYSWRFCPFCIRAKGLLDRKGIVYSDYLIDGDDTARSAMTRRALGRSTLPQIFINNRGIGGCDELYELERNGELDALLGLTA